MSNQPVFVQTEDVLQWMKETCVPKVKPDLDRMEWMLERLDHPERRCKFIHIAGTNGKGSTAAMISSVLVEAGYKTGLFVSPSVTQWNERIQIDHQPIPDEALVKWANYLHPHIMEMIEKGPGKPSPFEFWTLLALCYFAYDEVPWFIVWEAGLGGRWDATNLISPLVSVITQIGIDHKHFLGNSVSEIAQEKAGIIKPGMPVVCGATRAEAVEVITNVAKQKNSDLFVVNQDFQVTSSRSTSDGHQFHFSNVYRTLSDLKIPLVGHHQLQNAATAIMTLEVLRQRYATLIEDLHYEKGLKNVSWPGRLEQMSDQPTILLDGAHNADAVAELVRTVSEMYTYDRCLAMIAMMNDKEIDQVLQRLLPMVDHLVVTEVADAPRSMPAEELAEHVRKVKPKQKMDVFPSFEEGLKHLKQLSTDQDLLLITGSFYLVSKTRSLLVLEKSATP